MTHVALVSQNSDVSQHQCQTPSYVIVHTPWPGHIRKKILLTVCLTSSRLRWDFGFRVQLHQQHRSTFRLGGNFGGLQCHETTVHGLSRLESTFVLGIEHRSVRLLGLSFSLPACFAVLVALSRLLFIECLCPSQGTGIWGKRNSSEEL